MKVTLNELEVSIYAWEYKTDSKNMAQKMQWMGMDWGIMQE